MGTENNGIVVCVMDPETKDRPVSETVLAVKTFSHDGIVGFETVYERQPWLTATNPSHVLLLSQSGKVAAFRISFANGAKFTTVQVPRVSSLHQSYLAPLTALSVHRILGIETPEEPGSGKKKEGREVDDVVAELGKQSLKKGKAMSEMWPIRGGDVRVDDTVFYSEVFSNSLPFPPFPPFPPFSPLLLLPNSLLLFSE